MSNPSLFNRIKTHLLWRLDQVNNTDFFLRNVRGVVHVGANEGQERQEYAKRQLEVLWIEPIPEVYEKLKINIQGCPRQTCLNYLVTDVDDKEYVFHISNQGGISSSIFDFGEHRKLWPEIDFNREVLMRGISLKTLFQQNRIDVKRYDALVLDTQGSELLVLKGMAGQLSQFKYIKTEVADFESYEGGCKLDEMEAYLKQHGFYRARKKCFIQGTAGKYYDIVYARSFSGFRKRIEAT